MGLVVLSPEAQKDLDDISFRIGLDKPRAAVRWLRQIKQTFDLLGDFPRIRPARPEVRKSLRSFPVKKYVIFYEVVEGGVEIVRVLHGARAMPEIFEEEQ